MGVLAMNSILKCKLVFYKSFLKFDSIFKLVHELCCMIQTKLKAVTFLHASKAIQTPEGAIILNYRTLKTAINNGQTCEKYHQYLILCNYHWPIRGNLNLKPPKQSLCLPLNNIHSLFEPDCSIPLQSIWIKGHNVIPQLTWFSPYLTKNYWI